QNKMTVEQVYYDNKIHQSSNSINHDNHALMAMVLANDSKLDDNNQLLGDPTETALIQYALDQKIDVHNLLANHKRLQEVPFD
ncbi:MAG: ATPase, partial [Lactobacillus sp.]|nr:ATPase [Lactobacillus sp.]